MELGDSSSPGSHSRLHIMQISFTAAAASDPKVLKSSSTRAVGGGYHETVSVALLPVFNSV